MDVEHVPLDDRPAPQPGPPVVAVDDQALRAQRAGVEHELEQLVLARDVAVQRHRGKAELGRHAGHRDRVKPLGVGDPDGGFDDRVGRQTRPRPALAALAPPP
jgi:hypothetical protein